MFLLFELAADPGIILGVVPEPLEILISGIALILLTIGLRWLMKRGEADVRREIEKTE